MFPAIYSAEVGIFRVTRDETISFEESTLRIPLVGPTYVGTATADEQHLCDGGDIGILTADVLEFDRFQSRPSYSGSKIIIPNGCDYGIETRHGEIKFGTHVRPFYKHHSRRTTLWLPGKDVVDSSSESGKVIDLLFEKEGDIRYLLLGGNDSYVLEDMFPKGSFYILIRRDW